MQKKFRLTHKTRIPKKELKIVCNKAQQRCTQLQPQSLHISRSCGAKSFVWLQTKKTYGHCSALKQLRRFLWNISECLSSCCEISTQAWSRKRATFALSSTSTTVQVPQSVHITIPVSSPPISWKFRNLSFMWLWFHVNISIAFKRHRFEKKSIWKIEINRCIICPIIAE